MAIKDLTLLALLWPGVMARPERHHAHVNLHGREADHKHSGPFGHSGGYSVPAGTGTGSVPFPAGNSTSVPGSTGVSGSGGPIHITSTISVVPQPVSGGGPGETGGPGGSGGSGASGGPGGSGGVTGGGSGATGGAGGSECGPATVTETVANTVTVTITPPAGGPGGPGGAGFSAVPPLSSVPPFPVGNSTSAAGTGTGTAAGTAALPPVVVYSSSSSLPAAAAEVTSSSIPHPVPLAQEKKVQKAPVAAPKVTTSSIPHPVPLAQEKKVQKAPVVAAEDKHKQPNYGGPYGNPYVAPPVSSSSSSAYIPPAVETPPAQVYTPPAPQITPSSQDSSPVVEAEAAPSSSAAPSTQSPSKPKSPTVGAKGAAYNTADQVQGRDIAWGCNWGQEPGLSPTFDYVPQLWGKKNGFDTTIKANSASAKAVLYYNEPDISTDLGGSGIDVGTAISDFSIMQDIQKLGKKISSPCVANSGLDYADQFLSAFPKGSVDILCFHWYGEGVENLKIVVDQFAKLKETHGCSEMWINEWAVQPTPSDLSEYTSYLDGAVDRYAYNMNDIAGAQY